jgi:hypothetical protein
MDFPTPGFEYGLEVLDIKDRGLCPIKHHQTLLTGWTSPRLCRAGAFIAGHGIRKFPPRKRFDADPTSGFDRSGKICAFVGDGLDGLAG